jgi:hypothetical protein
MLKRTRDMSEAEKAAQPRPEKLVRQMHDVRGWDDPPWSEEEEQNWIDLFQKPGFDFVLYKSALCKFSDRYARTMRPRRSEVMEMVALLRGQEEEPSQQALGDEF